MKRVILFLLFVQGLAQMLIAQPFYLRGEASPCDWGNSSAACQLTDPDGNGIYELTYNFGTASIGRKEFKIYNAGNDSWYPGSNAWFFHQGGSVTFKFNTANNLVDATDGSHSICAPGAFSGWNNAAPMTNVGGTVWCYTIPTPGSYEWKPTRCGSWDSWQPNNGTRNVNSGNWSVTTTTPNEQVCVTYDPATGRVIPPTQPIGIFLRGSAGPCGWGNASRDCEMKDPDGDGCYELIVNLGSTPLGFQEFKVYNSTIDTWYPGGANTWYFHRGGAVKFRYCKATNQVEALDGLEPNLCAPGEFLGWDNTKAMGKYADGLFCVNVPTPGTYEWKPTVCGTWNSWQPVTGERSVGSDNWRITTTMPNQQVCVSYEQLTGRAFLGAKNVPTMTQWGLFAFGLLVSIFGYATVLQRRRVLAGAENTRFSLRSFPFNKELFTTAILFVAVLYMTLFTVASWGFGYELSNADLPGSLMSMPLFAYLLMLLSDKKH